MHNVKRSKAGKVLQEQWGEKENVQSESMFECHTKDTVTTKSMNQGWGCSSPQGWFETANMGFFLIFGTDPNSSSKTFRTSKSFGVLAPVFIPLEENGLS